MESSIEIPQEIKKFLTTILSSNSILSIWKKKKNESTNLKRCMHPNVPSSIIYNSQDLETTKVPNCRWMNEDVACVCVYTSFHIYILYVQRDTTQPLKTDAFKLWCWRMLLRVPWTAGRANQSILKEINPEYSLQGLMLKMELQIPWPSNAKSWFTGKDPDARKD